MRNTPPTTADVLLVDLPVDGNVISVKSGVGGVVATVSTALLVAATDELAVVALASIVVVVPPAIVVVGATVSVLGVQLGRSKTLLSSVTAPLRASALPCTTTELSTVIEVSARMLPTNTEPLPNVAELPTCQNTLHSDAPLISAIELRSW